VKAVAKLIAERCRLLPVLTLFGLSVCVSSVNARQTPARAEPPTTPIVGSPTNQTAQAQPKESQQATQTEQTAQSQQTQSQQAQPQPATQTPQATAVGPLITREEAVRLAATAFDVYSALLLYTGSCTADVYASAIRPAMADADPAFSGRWASDYEPLPSLLREIRRIQSSRRLASLLRAVRPNQLVHMSIACRWYPMVFPCCGRQDTTGTAR